jgi:undecaprenyl diphosphate synthase
LSQQKPHESRLTLTPSEKALFDRIDPSRLPKHIAIIMDGNGRWANQRDLSRIKGHKAAIPAVQNTVEACVDLGIQHLTLYAFSKENWKRPQQETGTLMALLRQYLRLEAKTVHKHKLRVQAIGAIEDLSNGIQKDLKKIVAKAKDYDGMRFNIALNYSGRGDIVRAVKAYAAAGGDFNTLEEDTLSNYLSTADQPDPDLVIRTSGELRISNFLLWQIAYSEIWVTSTLWPDFRREHLYEGILNYQSRHRRFGGI